MFGTSAPSQPAAPTNDLMGLNMGQAAPVSGGMGDLFGGSTAPVAQPPVDLFGGSNLLGGGNDGFSDMQSAAPSFPAYIAFEDNFVQIGFSFKRDPSANNNHSITAIYKNKSGSNLSGVNIQVAAQKYMVLKMKPASGSTLAGYAQNLSQEMNIVNSMEGQKPMSLKLKINYTPDGQAAVS